MPIPEGSLTQVVRTGLESACKEFTVFAAPLGFARTKKMFWTRQREHTVEFVHFHRSGSSYGAPLSASVSIRVHFGVRVLNDSFAAAALNGPNSDPGGGSIGRYHLRFHASTGSTFDRCVQDLARFLSEQGEPWFQQFADARSLLERADSPLGAEAKTLLLEAINGQAKPESVAASLKLLGIKSAET